MRSFRLFSLLLSIGIISPLPPFQVMDRHNNDSNNNCNHHAEAFSLPVLTTTMRHRRHRSWGAGVRSDLPENGELPSSSSSSTTPGLTNDDDDDDDDNNSSSGMESLAAENEELRATVARLQSDVERLQQQQQQNSDDDDSNNSNSNQNNNRQLVLENFEGEFSGVADAEVALMRGDRAAMERWCARLPDPSCCPVEPSVGFGEALRDRALWLIGLLVFQSVSGIILANNEELLVRHPVIVYYLTMLVGAGGNAGNQASVRVIRGLALGTLNPLTQTQFLAREAKMAAALSVLLSVAGFCRAALFRTPLPETLAVTAALFMIVVTSVCLGAVLPLALKRVGVDPAHSSTSIQVIMDILGVVLAVVMSTVILDGPLGALLIDKLGGDVPAALRPGAAGNA